LIQHLAERPGAVHTNGAGALGYNGMAFPRRMRVLRFRNPIPWPLLPFLTAFF